MEKKCSLDMAVRTLLGSTGISTKYQGYFYLQKILTVLYENPKLYLGGMFNLVTHVYSATMCNRVINSMNYAIKKAYQVKTDFFVEMMEAYRGTDWYSCTVSDYIQSAVCWLNQHDLVSGYPDINQDNPDVRDNSKIICYKWT